MARKHYLTLSGTTLAQFLAAAIPATLLRQVESRSRNAFVASRRVRSAAATAAASKE